MIQKILIAISIPFFFLLQACVFTSLELGNVIPNLMVLIVCVYGFFYGEKTGAICGFFAGLLMDIFFSEMLGLNALIIMLIGYANGGFSGLFRFGLSAFAGKDGHSKCGDPGPDPDPGRGGAAVVYSRLFRGGGSI